MGDYLQLFVITTTTVGKIMLCAVAGMVASRFFVEPEKSEKGLSFISVRIFLPCLLFSNLCYSVTVDSIRQFYSAPLLACLPLCLGLASSFLFRAILDRKYHALIMLGCTFQNGLTFPLSLILNLKGVSWLDSQAVDDAQSYIFLYNIVCSIALWAVGEPLIAAAKAAELEAEDERFRLQEEEQEKQREHLHGVNSDAMENLSFALPFQEREMAAKAHENSENADARKKHYRHNDSGINRSSGDPSRDSTQTSSDTHQEIGGSNGGGREDASTSRSSDGEMAAGKETAARQQNKRSATATEQLTWYKPAKAYDQPIKPPRPAVVYTDEEGHVVTRDPEEEEAVKHNRCSVKRVNGILVRSFKSPTVFFSLVAIAVSLVPPLRWLAESFVGRTVIGGLTVAGSGAIPLQLLVLGCTIASNKPKEDTASPPATQRQEQATAPLGTEAMAHGDEDGEVIVAAKRQKRSAADRIGACVKPATLFIVCSLLLRTVILPAVCFLVIHLLNKAGMIPGDRVFLLSMLVATSSPSAINSSVICSMHNYHSKQYARMIFFMYIASIFSTAIYLFFYILYLGW